MNKQSYNFNHKKSRASVIYFYQIFRCGAVHKSFMLKVKEECFLNYLLITTNLEKKNHKFHQAKGILHNIHDTSSIILS